MNQELIDMAKQAGWEYAHDNSGYEPLWKFAALVAAAEREACAKVCDAFHEGVMASLIRARGEA